MACTIAFLYRSARPPVIIQWLPAYAPDLNPMEQIWNLAKGGDVANLAPSDADDLRGHIRRSLIRQRHRPASGCLGLASDQSRRKAISTTGPR